jgi:thiol-disulfide isomerase/thioredoxin
MRGETVKRVTLVACLLTGCGAPPAPHGTYTEPVTLRVVKWPALEAHLAKQHGKVVLIDIWLNTCIPCKKEFPHFVELHRKFAEQGLVCISLNTDEPSEKEIALEYLKSKKATFDNFLIDEPIPVWQEKLHTNTAPAALIFGHDGKLRKDFGDDEFTYVEVEKAVVEALAERNKSVTSSHQK